MFESLTASASRALNAVLGLTAEHTASHTYEPELDHDAIAIYRAKVGSIEAEYQLARDVHEHRRRLALDWAEACKALRMLEDGCAFAHCPIERAMSSVARLVEERYDDVQAEMHAHELDAKLGLDYMGWPARTWSSIAHLDALRSLN